jgi:AraC-like DNA-binding protein
MRHRVRYSIEVIPTLFLNFWAKTVRDMQRRSASSCHSEDMFDLKLEKAKEPLAARESLRIEIAHACGFCSYSHLSTAFCKPYGTTPQ